MNPLKAAYQEILNKSKLKGLQEFASNPDTHKNADELVGDLTIGQPFSQVPGQVATRFNEAKAIVKNPAGEFNKYNEAEMRKPLKQRIEENLGMAAGILGEDSRFGEALRIDKQNSRIKILKKAQEMSKHLNSAKVLPKTANEIALKKMIEESGGVYGGVMHSPDSSIVNFTAKRGETSFPMALETNNLTPEIIKAKILEKSKLDAAELVRKANLRNKKGSVK